MTLHPKAKIRLFVSALIAAILFPLLSGSSAYSEARIRVATIGDSSFEPPVVSPAKKYVGLARYHDSGGKFGSTTYGPWYILALPSMKVIRVPKMPTINSESGISISLIAIGDDGTTCFRKDDNGIGTVFIVSIEGQHFEILSSNEEYKSPPFSKLSLSQAVAIKSTVQSGTFVRLHNGKKTNIAIPTLPSGEEFEFVGEPEFSTSGYIAAQLYARGPQDTEYRLAVANPSESTARELVTSENLQSGTPLQAVLISINALGSILVSPPFNFDLPVGTPLVHSVYRSDGSLIKSLLSPNTPLLDQATDFLVGYDSYDGFDPSGGQEAALVRGTSFQPIYCSLAPPLTKKFSPYGQSIEQGAFRDVITTLSPTSILVRSSQRGIYGLVSKIPRSSEYCVPVSEISIKLSGRCSRFYVKSEGIKIIREERSSATSCTFTFSVNGRSREASVGEKILVRGDRKHFTGELDARGKYSFPERSIGDSFDATLFSDSNNHYPRTFVVGTDLFF